MRMGSDLSDFMGTRRLFSSTRTLATKRAMAGTVSPRAEISYIMIKPDGAKSIVFNIELLTIMYPCLASEGESAEYFMCWATAGVSD